MTDVVNIGLPPHLYCLPLTAGLEGHAGFYIQTDASARIAIKLRERKLDAAFLSIIDYARESSEYLIVPGVAASSEVPNGSVVIHFKKGIRDITRLAVDPSSTSEIILAKILLAEEFDREPSIVPVAGSLDTMLEKGDAALLVGDLALREAGDHPGSLDLVEAWKDLTDLPYVHGFWCLRERGLSRDQVIQLQKGLDTGSLQRLAAKVSGSVPQSGTVVHEFLQTFSYELSPAVRESIREFMHYAYYHGVLPDVGELNFFEVNPGDPLLPPDISSN